MTASVTHTYMRHSDCSYERYVDESDAYIVVSFVNATLVLSVGESVEEVQDSGLQSDTPTLLVQQMGEDTLIQVHPEGVRHILADRRVNEWKPPANRMIMHATANQRQAAVALNTGEVVYFELDEHGQLNEYQERLNTGSNVLCMALGQVLEGRIRFQFLVSSSLQSVLVAPLSAHLQMPNTTGRWLRRSDSPHLQSRARSLSGGTDNSGKCGV